MHLGNIIWALFYEFKAVLSCLKIINSKSDIVIFDDIFPHNLSPFRIEEFTEYLYTFSDIKIYSTASAFPVVNEKRSFRKIAEAYFTIHPETKNKVLKYRPHLYLSSKLAYIVFLSNMWAILSNLERHKVPFIFTLYPGGGFLLNDSNCDNRLKIIFQSKYFRHVVVTQKVVYNYLVEKKLCPKEKITYIFGVVMPISIFESAKKFDKHFFKKDKSSFDVCFVAHKYSHQGKDKGYDIFIETARLLHSYSNDFHFHIVGPWSIEDYNINGLEKNIHFYGSQSTSFFSEFYSKMDIILSPNRPNILNYGSFDGFPTGAVTEASLNGVAMFITDPLDLNEVFINNEEIVLINEKPIEIVEIIIPYYKQPLLLYTLASKGSTKSWEIYGKEAQMNPRISLLKKQLELE